MTSFLLPFFTTQQDLITITADQGSRFAKTIADDFNPLHDPDNKLFCVPGDLLFAIALQRHGLYEQMHFRFTGMVGAGTTLQFPDSTDNNVAIKDNKGKEYLTIEREGAVSHDAELIEQFTCSYVAFSGHNFPDLLVPLMTEQGVMLNPSRPIAIYDSMLISLENIQQLKRPRLRFNQGVLELKGKKGDVRLEFAITDDEQVVGSGIKFMSLRGLKAYEPESVEHMVDTYNQHKTQLSSGTS